MLKRSFTIIIIMFIFFVSAYSAPVNGELAAGIIDTVRLSESDIPEGYMFGKIPEGVKPTLHDNPWKFDQAAITRLASVIYPEGDATSMGAVHFTIVTKKEMPYGDDIVCYLFLYKSASAAEKEIAKIKEYSEMNSDRVFYSVHDNIVVFMLVDDVEDYPVMRSLAEVVDNRFPK